MDPPSTATLATAGWTLFGAAAGLLLLTAGLTLWMRRMALRAQDADPAGVWFGYWRFLRGLVTGMWLGWLVLVTALHLQRLPEFLFGGSYQGMMAAWMLTVMVPPALANLLCNSLSHPVYARVRGTEWTRADLARQTAWAIGARLLPLGLLMVGLGALMDDNYTHTVLWAVAAFVAFIVFSRLYARAADWRPQALTVGALRDRIFALAEQAGVKLRQIYYLPAGKGRMANAFAADGQAVLLTDYLLREMDRREVDAVIAHELTHLKLDHPRKLRLAYAVPLGAAAGTGVGLAVVGWGDRWLPLIPAALVAGLLLSFFLSRRFERAADAGAVVLTGDPEALITALAKLMRLNKLPMEWGKWDERLLTHPSTMRRAEAIARVGGLPPERLPEVLARPDDGERYPLPPDVAGEERLFSTAFKSEVVFHLWWATLAVTAFAPALVAKLVEAAGLDGPARWTVYALGLAVAFGLHLENLNRIGVRGYAALERKLRERRAEDGAEGLFVGLAPGDRPRIYETHYDWDIGLLFVEPGTLRYAGEQARFALRPAQVTSVRVCRGSAGWLRGLRVCVAWSDPGSGAGGVFSVRPASAPTLIRSNRAARALADRLQAWQNGGDAPEDAAPAGPPPAFGAVTSQSPREFGRFGALLGSMVFAGLASAVAVVLLGLPLDISGFAPGEYAFSIGFGPGEYAVAATLLLAFLNWLPYRLYREPKAAGG